MNSDDRRNTRSEGGIVWRPLAAADADGLLGLVNRIEEVDNPPYRTTEGEVRAWLTNTAVWQGLLGIAADGPREGAPIAFAQVAVFRGSSGECLAKGGVDPDYRTRGVGARLVNWQVERGRLLYRECYPDEPGHLLISIDPAQKSFEEHLHRVGYSLARTTHELRRDLTDLPTAVNIGSYHKIMPWSPDLDDQAWRLYNRMLEIDHRNHHSRNEWLEQRESFTPEWSFVAVSTTGDRPKVEGFVIVAAYQQDWDVLGWKEGYIDLLGVTDSSATTELSYGLVTASMAAQRAAGMDRVATAVVDTGNDQATKLYFDLGFKKSFETRTYSLEI